jgi:hypothetical protein
MRTTYLMAKSSLLILLVTMFSTTAFSQVIADNQVKQHVTVISNPLQRIISLEPKTFEYNKDKFKELGLPGGTHYGFLAENVQQAFPDLITYRNYNYSAGKNMPRTAKIKSVDVEGLIPVLVASIKEQQLEIEKLKAEIQSLKKNGTAANF